MKKKPAEIYSIKTGVYYGEYKDIKYLLLNQNYIKRILIQSKMGQTFIKRFVKV